jgi:hypothetical protein
LVSLFLVWGPLRFVYVRRLHFPKYLLHTPDSVWRSLSHAPALRNPAWLDDSLFRIPELHTISSNSVIFYLHNKIDIKHATGAVLEMSRKV